MRSLCPSKVKTTLILAIIALLLAQLPALAQESGKILKNQFVPSLSEAVASRYSDLSIMGNVCPGASVLTTADRALLAEKITGSLLGNARTFLKDEFLPTLSHVKEHMELSSDIQWVGEGGPQKSDIAYLRYRVGQRDFMLSARGGLNGHIGISVALLPGEEASATSPEKAASLATRIISEDFNADPQAPFRVSATPSRTPGAFLLSGAEPSSPKTNYWQALRGCLSKDGLSMVFRSNPFYATKVFPDGGMQVRSARPVPAADIPEDKWFDRALGRYSLSGHQKQLWHGEQR